MTEFSIDVGGLWSPAQARKVIEALKHEAEEAGVVLSIVDVTVYDMPHPRVLISVCSTGSYRC